MATFRHPVDEAFYPPFDGFPRKGIEFLKKLKRNNNRPWFQKHKQEYEDYVRFPMQCLIAALARELHDDIPEIEFNPKRSLFRIYRDVRFSKNKAPYKTNVAASFQPRGAGSGIELPGLYVGVEPGEMFVGGGLYLPTGDQLKSIRTAIAERPDEFLAVVENTRFKKRFGTIMGEKLQKAPLGFPKDHPMIEYLKYKQFYVGVEWDDEAPCYSRTFARTVADIFRDCIPFVRWLADAVSMTT
jgi:uncharacterized protein (TIGR02453 family)